MNATARQDRRGGAVAVVGGGIGGLAAAATLAARGHAVTLFEKNAWLGGKATRLETDGFSFDMGPTVLTLPSVFRRIFAEAGRDFDSAVDLVRLDPQWRCFFNDGSTLDLVEDADRMAASLKTFSGGAADGYPDFLALAGRMRDISERFFFWRSVEGVRDTIDLKSNMSLATLGDLFNLRMGATVAGTVRGRVKDARVAQMLDHFTQYLGSSPFAAPAILCSIADMQVGDGVWYPRGGASTVAEALADLAGELGVTLRTGIGVRRILTRDGRVTGLETEDGERTEFRAVVSNMDAVRTYRELIGGAVGKRFERRRREPACSGVVLYLGIDRAYEHLAHHNFAFSRNPEEEFDWIYRKGEPAPDPSCYIAAPARTDPAVAPDGGEALYVLVHTPYLRPHHDWQTLLAGYRETILAKLARTAGLSDLESRIVTEKALTPADIHERYRVLNGAIYGLASHGRFTGAFKPGNRRRDLKGLYLGGGAAHPGPGMPMVAMSGWIAADTLDRDLADAAGRAHVG